MSRALRPNYAQMFLLPPSLDEWVPPEHPVRFVRDFVDTLDLPALGLVERENKGDEGRPHFPADLLLKIWLFGWMERIRSTRGLEKACLQVMPFLWLTGNQHPDHNTIWRFFRDNRKALRPLFKQIVQVAARAGLVGFALHALDGTKMTAASSTDTAQHRKSLEDKLKELDQFIDAYVREVQTRGEQEEQAESYTMPAALQDAAARKEKIRELLARRIEAREEGRDPTKTPKEKAEPAPPAEAPKAEAKPTPPAEAPKAEAKPAPPTEADALQSEAFALKKELHAALAQLDAAQANHLHPKEPEAQMMKGRGMHALGYNAQAVLDHDSDLIVASDVVVQQNDQGQLVPMLEQVRDTLGRVADQTVSDSGYRSGEELIKAEQQGMPVLVTTPAEPATKGDYTKSHFRYDADHNVYICPQGEQLVQIGTNKSRASASPDAVYRCHNSSCPVRSACTDNQRGRQIRRSPFEDALTRQQDKQQDPQMRILLSLRKEIIEHLFGIVKSIDGFRRFTVRGLEKVRAQWALVCSSVNLRKLYVFWQQGKLVLGSTKTPDPSDGAPLASAA